jgi:hypothetical protein
LRSFEHPKNELKPVPRVDSSGDVCGATFKVDAETKLLHYLSTQIWQRKTKEEEEEKLSIWIRAVTPPAIPPPYPPLQRVVPVTIQRTEIIT